jgi:Ca2+-binding EF-hand superfamily protein
MLGKVSTHSFRYNFIRSVEELIFELDPNHDGEITEDEFNVICKYISQGGRDSFPPINGKSST